MRKMEKSKKNKQAKPHYIASQYRNSLVEDYKEFEMDKIADK